ncbi:MAG: Nucleoside ABC transporter, periplasmic nucleoside-binding protein [Candidatus Ozemobacter sibiricus]|jgi:simple sugar transport system substrate-binding protein|uniref:Nucleoside ABC transporter, periplasmic nucleoside-binding protein n=1 Tax=Candidatus Ozemobacter sibiricus TaxID=2268124 RepID=A0A367ZQQ1_9BACT|nr:MAG: Nucleoside ABC transporter, periplasmic nucleoside-binding protein [Candidatus Ozemobacter sibiricus]
MQREYKWFLPGLVGILVVLGGWLSAAQGREGPPAEGKPVKAGLIYVGPIGDYGWTNAHEQARQALVKKFPWLTTTYVESVPEADAGRVIDRLITEENCDVVFATSFGYMNDTVAAAQRYPDKIFAHCSGYKQAKNLATYFAELYQAYYLNGLMAGALTKSHKVGYVGAHPIPEVVRHINAYALGVREVNPQARVHVKWLYSWYDPAKCREAAEALVAEGCDALAFTEDSPAVIQVGEEHTAKGRPVYTFSHYSPMGRFGPNSAVSGQLVDWTGLYEMLVTSIREGRFEGKDHWWLMKEGAAAIGAEPGQPINPKFVEVLKKIEHTDPVLGKTNIHDLVMKRIEQMTDATVSFDPFTGPIKDNTGQERIKAGERATHDQLWTIDWYVDNVVGSVPK